MSDSVTDVRAVVTPAPSTQHVVAVNRCKGGPEEQRCFVCRLMLSIARAPDDHLKAGREPDREPLHINLVGMRLHNSLSDHFDDWLAAFLTPPPPEIVGAVTSDLGEDLLKDLKKAATARTAKDHVKVIHCSEHGAWVVGLFPISTDPGFVARKADLAQVDLAIKKANDDKKLAQDLADELTRLCSAKDQADKKYSDVRTQKPRDNAAISTARDSQVSAKAQVDGCRKRRKDLKLLQPKSYDQPIKSLNEKKKKLEERFNAYKDGHSHSSDHSQEKGILEISAEGEDGFFGEGRGMIRPAFHQDQYTYFIHKAGSLDNPNAMPALKTDSILGMRVWSVKFVCKEPERFIERFQVREWTKADGAKQKYAKPFPWVQLYDADEPGKRRAFLGDEALGPDDQLLLSAKKSLSVATLCSAPARNLRPPVVLAVKQGSGYVDLPDAEPQALLRLVRSANSVHAFIEKEDKRTALEDDALVFLSASPGGTNIHRAHNTKLDQNGELTGGTSSSVADWSEGCQTFPNFEDFNLFLRLCAVSKHWRCPASKEAANAQSCRRLYAPGSQGASPSEGEKALLAWGKPQFDEAVERITVKKDHSKKEKLHRLEALMRKKLLTDEEADEKAQLQGERDDWREEQEWKDTLSKLVWEKARRYWTDWLRICDLNRTCQQKFSYTLVDLPGTELESLLKSFQDEPGKPWDGDLCF